MDLFWNYFNDYGLIIIFIFIVFEYACLPLPSEVLLPLCGTYCIIYNYNVFLMILLSIISGLIGSSICYFLGLFGKNIIFKLFKNKKLINLESSLNSYDKYNNLSISIGRCVPLIRTYISFVAGMRKQNYLKFLILTTLGITIWNTILILLGYNFYGNLDVIISFYKKYSTVILIIIPLLIIIYIIKKYKRGNKYERYKDSKNKCYESIRPKESFL